MAHITLYDLLWITLDPDTETSSLIEGPKKLADICAEKLISDVLLVKRYCLRLPKTIHRLIFSTAFAKKRILSIEQLMKFCPHETLVMPIPEVLKSLHIIPQSLHKSIRTLPWMYSDAERELMDSTRISMTMLSVFLDLIRKNNSGSLLQTLDLGLFPLRNAALVKIQQFLFIERAKVPLFTKTYTLKCTVAVENPTDLHILRTCTERSNSVGFDLNITGVYFYNDCFMDLEAAKLFNSLKKPDLELITFSYGTLIPNFNLFFNELKFFRFVKYLNLSYLVTLLSSETDARTLVKRLTELMNLERLVLKGMNLHGMLSMLLEYCKRNSCDVSTPDCCFIHCGSLCYLDLSSCFLSHKDLEFLKELSVTNSLKYLDISVNSLDQRRTFEILLFLKSSLQALNISYCFKHLIVYDDAIMPFSAFTQLKYLNIKGLRISECSKHLLENELQKMPNLEIIETSIPISLAGVTIY